MDKSKYLGNYSRIGSGEIVKVDDVHRSLILRRIRLHVQYLHGHSQWISKEDFFDLYEQKENQDER